MMKKWKLITLLIWLFFISLPMFVGYLRSDNEVSFGGLIFNPIDGYSYLAKMQQGASGEFSFQLPYTPEENGTVFIFTFYILMGHISRIFGIDIPIMFHIFRIGISLLFFFSLEPLLKKLFHDEDIFFKSAYISLLFGGGLGWIYFVFGDLPIDFWVSEAFIFLSSLSNPHFILSFLIISVLLKLMFDEKNNIKSMVIHFLLSIILTSVSPFAAIIFCFVLLINLIQNRNNFRLKMKNLLSFAIPAFLLGGYQYITIKNDPILRAWDTQNVTLTPGILNLFFGLSPFLIGIIVFMVLNIKKKIQISKPIWLMIIWIFFALVMVFIPFNLQRRFLVVIYLPITIVFWNLAKSYFHLKQTPLKKVLPTIILGSVFLSNLIIFAGSTTAINNQDEIFFINKNVISAFDWMDQNLEDNSIILSNEPHGLVIPAFGHYRVVYGHPFESIRAEEMKMKVNDFWVDQMSEENAKKFITENNVGYIFCEYEKTINGCPPITDQYEVIYNSDHIAIFQVEH
ncbi:MAG TPA: hypothetical protein VK856_07410 [Anaerolineaceae bacterium]|nr:hypothetical protein [Anaerolineaceae bacterium]